MLRFLALAFVVHATAVASLSDPSDTACLEINSPRDSKEDTSAECNFDSLSMMQTTLHKQRTLEAALEQAHEKIAELELRNAALQQEVWECASLHKDTSNDFENDPQPRKHNPRASSDIALLSSASNVQDHEESEEVDSQSKTSTDTGCDMEVYIPPAPTAPYYARNGKVHGEGELCYQVQWFRDDECFTQLSEIGCAPWSSGNYHMPMWKATPPPTWRNSNWNVRWYQVQGERNKNFHITDWSGNGQTSGWKYFQTFLCDAGTGRDRIFWQGNGPPKNCYWQGRYGNKGRIAMGRFPLKTGSSSSCFTCGPKIQNQNGLITR